MKERKVNEEFIKDRDAQINKEGETHLHVAAREGNLDLIKLLVEKVIIKDKVTC